MPAPKLRQYSHTTSATAGTLGTVVPAIPIDRALVISKLTVVNTFNGTDSLTFRILIGTNDDPTWAIAWDVPLAVGEVYTETSLVVPAGYLVRASASRVSGARVNVFGQEVDN